MGINWGNPITRQYLLEMLPDDDPRLPANVREFRDLNVNMDESGQSLRMGGNKWAADYLDVLDKYGASSTLDLPDEVRSQLPHQGFYYSGGGQTFGDQLKDFVTSPAFLTLAGGLGAVYAAPAAAGAGAAEGATAGGAATGGAAAGESAALGGGISAGATGASGLSTTAGGASGVSASGAAGTSLAPGFFTAEGLGTAATGALSLSGSGGSGGSSPPAQSQQPTAEQQTALQKILSGTATTQDYITAFGQVAPSLLGMYAANEQADALSGLAGQYMAMGQPYRDRLAGLYSDPTAFLKSPEVQVPVQLGTDALARSLSVQGNPAGSGTALHALQDRASNLLFSRLGEEKDRLSGFGGLTAYNSAAPQAATNAIGAERGVYDALGYGIGQVTNPPRSLADILKSYNISQGLA